MENSNLIILIVYISLAVILIVTLIVCSKIISNNLKNSNKDDSNIYNNFQFVKDDLSEAQTELLSQKRQVNNQARDSKTIAILKTKDSSWQINKNMIIGRDYTESDIVIEDSYISKCHTQIVIKNGNVFVRDLGSKNGTAINGKIIKEIVLVTQPVDIKIGRSILKLEIM